MESADRGLDIEHPDDAVGGEDGTQSILYPVFEDHDAYTFEIARDVAEGADAGLIVLDLVEDEESLTDEAHTVGKQLLRSKLDEHHDVSVSSLIETTSDPPETVAKIAQAYDVHLIVFDRHTPDALVDSLRGDVAERISDRVHCDAVSVDHAGDDRLSSILVPIADGPHSPLAVSVAGALGKGADAAVELFHVSTGGDTDRVDELFERALARLPDDVDADTWHLERADVADAIVEQSEYYDVTAIGEPQKNRLKRFVLGSVTDDISDRADNTVLVCRRSDGQKFDI
ncbi:universal stress protein [Natronoarchaeum mannanilyticum]|uniref:UspA domain-containing protein n=1 Tax=Natronoarchaeum mannanilyticum TaxID=926360 RepID=A0AAV3TC09_9EURY